MSRKYGLISIIFGIIGIILLFLLIIPIAAMSSAGWGGSPNAVLFFAIVLVIDIFTIGFGIYGKGKDESRSASIAGMVIGFIIIIAWILALLWYII